MVSRVRALAVPRTNMIHARDLEPKPPNALNRAGYRCCGRSWHGVSVAVAWWATEPPTSDDKSWLPQHRKPESRALYFGQKDVRLRPVGHRRLPRQTSNGWCKLVLNQGATLGRRRRKRCPAIFKLHGYRSRLLCWHTQSSLNNVQPSRQWIICTSRRFFGQFCPPYVQDLRRGPLAPQR